MLSFLLLVTCWVGPRIVSRFSLSIELMGLSLPHWMCAMVSVYHGSDQYTTCMYIFILDSGPQYWMCLIHIWAWALSLAQRRKQLMSNSPMQKKLAIDWKPYISLAVVCIDFHLSPNWESCSYLFKTLALAKEPTHESSCTHQIQRCKRIDICLSHACMMQCFNHAT